ncbi:MAG: cyclic nucleotide-binding domain-containing protein [Bryobacteraceae bacterium]
MSQTARKGLPYQDPLEFLPRKRVQDFAKGSLIYGVEKASSDLYLVILGRVKVSTTADDGGETVSRMVRAEGWFGEPCLVAPVQDGWI